MEAREPLSDAPTVIGELVPHGSAATAEGAKFFLGLSVPAFCSDGFILVEVVLRSSEDLVTLKSPDWAVVPMGEAPDQSSHAVTKETISKLLFIQLNNSALTI